MFADREQHSSPLGGFSSPKSSDPVHVSINSLYVRAGECERVGLFVVGHFVLLYTLEVLYKQSLKFISRLIGDQSLPFKKKSELEKQLRVMWWYLNQYVLDHFSNITEYFSKGAFKKVQWIPIHLKMVVLQCPLAASGFILEHLAGFLHTVSL